MRRTPCKPVVAKNVRIKGNGEWRRTPVGAFWSPEGLELGSGMGGRGAQLGSNATQGKSGMGLGWPSSEQVWLSQIELMSRAANHFLCFLAELDSARRKLSFATLFVFST